MQLEISRYGMKIVPESGFLNTDERDAAFIEEVLGLKKAGDFVKLVRVDCGGLSALAYLETKRPTKKENDATAQEETTDETELQKTNRRMRAAGCCIGPDPDETTLGELKRGDVFLITGNEQWGEHIVLRNNPGDTMLVWDCVDDCKETESRNTKVIRIKEG